MKHLILIAWLVGQAVSPAGSGSRDRPAQEASRPDYVVGAQDVLKVSVFDEPQLSGTFRVDTDGSFTYPFVGQVKAVGQTLRTIEAELARMLADGYVKNPQVSIEVEQYRTRSFFVVGEVRSPGRYPLDGEVTLIEALAQAGSTTAAAGSELLILHDLDSPEAQPGGPGATPPNRTTRVNLADLQSGKLANNIVLREGDTIFVAKAERFFVTGHVKNPGAFTWERGMTVLQAMSLAGGLSERGSNRGIKVIRIVGSEKKEIKVKLTDLVEAGDTLVIRQRLL
ncbi:MAG: polysaccharide biosynthesis/export family protein [Vicinamibacterales bacterium]